MTAERQREAAAAASTFHVAMTILGAKAFVGVFDSWQGVVPTINRVRPTGAAFLAEALESTTQYRRQVEAIAVAYMRLARALYTGYTWQNVLTGETLTAVPLQNLREDFYNAVANFAPGALEGDEIPDTDPRDGDDIIEVRQPDGTEYEPYSLEEWLDGDDITVEDLDWLEDELEGIEDELDKELQAILDSLGPKRLEQQLRDMDEEADRQAKKRAEHQAKGKKTDDPKTHQQVDDEREEVHTKVGMFVASHAERVVMNGARRTEYRVGLKDDRVIGFVRVHEPKGHPPDAYPCGFCALLMTRGFVPISGKRPLYRTEKSAGGNPNEYGESPDQYHAGDHCRTEQVFNAEQIDDDKRFDLNRKLATMYKQRIAGKYGGDKALSEWRRYIRNLNAGQESA